MQRFDFSRLINKTLSEYTLVTFSEGYWNNSGDWVQGDATETVMQGAILSIKDSKIYQSEGTLNYNDKILFNLEPLKNALKSSKIIFEGNVYSIEDMTENAKFTGVYTYTLKWVSAFDKAEGEETVDYIKKLSMRSDGVLDD